MDLSRVSLSSASQALSRLPGGLGCPSPFNAVHSSARGNRSVPGGPDRRVCPDRPLIQSPGGIAAGPRCRTAASLRFSGLCLCGLCGYAHAGQPGTAILSLPLPAGTEEARICRELADAGGYTLIPKDSTNGFVEPAFESWRESHPHIRRYLVVGDCTDICIAQFALTAKAWHNARRLPLQVMVPLSLVDTYDGGTHQADLMNLTALASLQGNGIELYSHIVDTKAEV